MPERTHAVSVAVLIVTGTFFFLQRQRRARSGRQAAAADAQRDTPAKQEEQVQTPAAKQAERVAAQRTAQAAKEAAEKQREDTCDCLKPRIQRWRRHHKVTCKNSHLTDCKLIIDQSACTVMCTCHHEDHD